MNSLTGWLNICLSGSIALNSTQSSRLCYELLCYAYAYASIVQGSRIGPIAYVIDASDLNPVTQGMSRKSQLKILVASIRHIII